MKKLIILRQGQTDESGRLTEQAKEQGHLCIQKLRSCLTGLEKVEILTSTHPSAQATAGMLGEAFGVTPESNAGLYSDRVQRIDVRIIIPLIRKYDPGCDALILVGGYDCGVHLHYSYGYLELGKDFRSGELYRWDHWIIDKEAKTICSQRIE